MIETNMQFNGTFTFNGFRNYLRLKANFHAAIERIGAGFQYIYCNKIRTQAYELPDRHDVRKEFEKDHHENA